MKAAHFFSFALSCVLAAGCIALYGEEPAAPKRCELVPLPGQRVSFRIGGVEKTRWHFGGGYPRPFFFPFRGPSGGVLTRMGHPGAPNHDHHRSVWFAHHDVNGVDFWSDRTGARIRQKTWYAYRDGGEEAVMASLSGWYDGKGAEQMEQEIVAALRPKDNGEHALEIQIIMRPPPKGKPVKLGKTNFGFLAVRVAKTLSVFFGGGTLTGSEGGSGEKAIFGKRARWMDYSGPVAAGQGAERKTATEGITYFDHPDNPRYPSHWHVRADGWMGASFCMKEGLTIAADKPLTLRYLLHAHRGDYDAAKAEAVHAAFARRPGFRVFKSKKPHRQFDVERKTAAIPNLGRLVAATAKFAAPARTAQAGRPHSGEGSYMKRHPKIGTAGKTAP